MAAPLGNNNASKAKVWSAAIGRALEKRSRLDQKDALDDLAEKLLELCEAGDLGALKELGDRLEGKAVQQIAGNIGFTDLSEAELDRRIEQLERDLKG
jgi:hypothetical protein